MGAPEAGLWAFMGVGVVTTLIGAAAVFRKGAKFWHVGLPLLFGVLMLGLSVFGIEFIDKYKEIVRIVWPMLESPGPETYSKALDQIGGGELSPENAEIVRAIAVARPITGLDSLLQESKDRATSSAGTRTLEEVSVDVRARQQLAGSIAAQIAASGGVSEQSVDTLPAAVRPLVARELLAPSRSTQLTTAQRRALEQAAKIPPLRRKQ
jgi:hypothetical protein